MTSWFTPKLLRNTTNFGASVVAAERCPSVHLRISYLGHFISEKGVAMDDGKVQSVRDCPVPKTVK